MNTALDLRPALCMPLRPTAGWPSLLLSAVMCWCGTAQASNYEVIDLGGIAHRVEIRVYGLNQHGVAVGQGGGPDKLQHPMKFMPNGRRIDLAARDGMPSVRGHAVAVNNHGVTTGLIEPVFGQPSVAFIEQDGVMTLLPAASGAVPTVRGINDQGDVVGDVFTVDDECFGICGFVIRAGQWTTLPALQRAELSYARAINQSGLIVGESFQGANHRRAVKAVQWRNGRIQVLPGMEHLFAAAFGVNDQGDIVGEYRHTDDIRTHAFLWRAGALTDLDDQPDSNSYAWAINTAGQVIGSRVLRNQHGPFVTIDGSMHWLQDLLLPGPDGAWQIGDIHAINDAGQIVGLAADHQGQWHAVLLNPVSP